MQIKPANKLAEVAEIGQRQYEKAVLASEEFKKLLNNIENAAMDGYTLKEVVLDDSEIRSHKVYQRELVNAGYKVVFRTISGTNLLGQHLEKQVFSVSWAIQVEADE
ncbi:hypothetical protein [Domibacillus aminovorans]|uniref:Uncharacterized protein n=1 Tax=Domibacillus aminovorans TaxID=29332 RepID=A0A177L3X1_9BACI|nr:hypothetical protein [Domibacillus aminovorans]OAH60378.1 hypothetical protein AWH49_16760 [Domibacillus aminovorans]